MQLLIKQKVFSWGDSYNVFDESGEPRYKVKARVFALGHQIHVYDARTGQELGSIHQKLFSFLPTFEIVVNGKVMGTVRKRISLLGARYDVDYMGWEAEGDFFGWDYRVVKNGMPIMRITKQWMTWGDTYALDYSNPAHEMPGLLLVIAIDAANCDHD